MTGPGGGRGPALTILLQVQIMMTRIELSEFKFVATTSVTVTRTVRLALGPASGWPLSGTEVTVTARARRSPSHVPSQMTHY